MTRLLSHRSRYDLKLLPWAGAATLLSSTDAGAVTHATAVSGLAYVFLPLPLATGLPVHVNGFFEISENRRELWLGTDMKGAGLIRAQWNLALIRDAVCASYVRLVLATVDCMSVKGGKVHAVEAADSIYGIFPEGSKCVKPWDMLATHVFRALFSLKVVRCGQVWNAPNTVVFFTHALDGGPNLAALLLAVGIPICVAPAHVALGFEAAGCAVVRVTPALVRDRLRDGHAYKLSPEEAHTLLAYLVSDGCRASALIGLRVIPTAAGEAVSLTAASTSANGTLLICQTDAEHSLLAAAGRKVVHSRINTDGALLTVLLDPEFSVGTNLAIFSVAALRHVLPELLPPNWAASATDKEAQRGSVVAAGWEHALIGTAQAGVWMHELWRYASLGICPSRTTSALPTASHPTC